MNPKASHRVMMGEMELIYIVEMCKANPTDMHKAILRRLLQKYGEIVNGLAKPVRIEKETMSESLGMTEIVNVSILRKRAYEKFCKTPNDMGIAEMEHAEEYMYANGLFPTEAMLDAYEEKHNLNDMSFLAAPPTPEELEEAKKLTITNPQQLAKGKVDK